jgi:hypothetical protein
MLDEKRYETESKETHMHVEIPGRVNDQSWWVEAAASHDWSEQP